MPAFDTLIIYDTQLAVKDVIQRLEKILTQKDIAIFAKINHGKAAKEVGLTMQDEELLIFGNPKVGTPLMIENPAIGIELPLKILAWNDNHKTIVAYQDLDKLAKTFNIKSSSETIKNLKKFMKDLIETAIQ